MKVYYYFSVNDRFFTEATERFLEVDKFNEFYGLAFGRKEFLNTPIYKSVSYLSELDYSDEIDFDFLTEIEEKYNICIAELINSERHFWRLDKSKRIKYAEVIIKCIEKNYEDYGFDLIFSEGIDDFPSYFLQEFAEKHKIPFYYFVYSRIGGSMFLSNRKDTGPVDLELYYEKNRIEYLKNPASFEKTKYFIDDYVRNKSQPYYVTQSQMLYKVFSFDDIKVLAQSFKNFITDNNAYHAYENPLKFPINRLVKIQRKIKYRKYFENRFISLSNNNKQKYFIYPLHFHPEAATLIQGRWLNDQRAIIEMFSKVLPANVKLIVKEHKVSIGRRPLSFYKEINKYHNVYFVSEDTDVYSLIGNSLGVVTISSSMGLEAIMLNKPVITFGDIHYNILSQVVKARDISNLRDCVNYALNHTSYKEDEYWAFFKTITENCYEMPGYSPHIFNTQHLDTFISMLKKIIN